jgi:bacillithiol biosynthesis cysteine-adding enzyme BshC
VTVQIDVTPVGAASIGPALATARARQPTPPAGGILEATIALGPAAARLEALRSGAYVVTTGQQPGLLGGPLYGLYKGLAAAALAARLESELAQPVVPVFWVAGDDHDFREANHAAVLSTESDLLELVLRERPHDAAQLTLAQELVGDEISAVLTSLAEATPETEFKEGILSTLGRCYQPDATLADAYANWMAALLARAGVVVFRAYARSAKATAAPLLLQALERRAHRLAASGPVPTPQDATLVMVDSRLGRDRLIEDDGAYHTRRSQERWTTGALETLAREAPERLSPNVLLRPVAESSMWPTIAYVAGPGELAYLDQTGPLYEALEVPRQAGVPRFGARLVERRAVKVLQKLGIEADTLRAPAGALENKLARDELPPETSEAVAALRVSLETGYPRLADAVTAVDPTMKRPVKSAMGSALSNLADLEKRIIAHQKRQNETLVRQVERARLSLYPSGKPQERVLAWPSFGIRYGDALLDALNAAARGWANGLPLDAPEA